MRIPPPRSLLASSLTLLVIATAATACGDDGDKDRDEDDGRSSESASPSEAEEGSEEPDADGGTLSDDQIELAAITLDNLGEGWAEEPAEDDEDDDDEAPGCLGDIDRLTESLDDAGEFDVTYGHGEQGLPQVDSGVTTFANEDALTALFDQFQAELSKCSAVSWDDDGTKYELTFAVAPDLSGIEVDDQSSFVASGQLTTDTGETSPLHLYGSFFRVGPNIATVSSTSLSEIPAEHEAWAIIGADRLSAVVAGEEPEETTAPTL